LVFEVLLLFSGARFFSDARHTSPHPPLGALLLVQIARQVNARGRGARWNMKKSRDNIVNKFPYNSPLVIPPQFSPARPAIFRAAGLFYEQLVAENSEEGSREKMAQSGAAEN